MIYVFDTSSIRSLQHFYPSVFKTIWDGLEALVQQQQLISTREVWNEVQTQNISEDVLNWVKNNKQIFTTPSEKELQFVVQIFQKLHFQSLISAQSRLKGTPVADPFVIACAKTLGGTVVTEEQFKPNAAKIPNVCQYFGIPCIDLEEFMKQQDWKF